MELVALPTPVDVAVAVVALASFLTRVMGVMQVRPAALSQTDNGIQWRVLIETVSRARVGTSRLPVESGAEDVRVASAGSAYAYDGDGLSIYSGDIELQAGDPVRVLNSVPLPDGPITLGHRALCVFGAPLRTQPRRPHEPVAPGG